MEPDQGGFGWKPATPAELQRRQIKKPKGRLGNRPQDPNANAGPGFVFNPGMAPGTPGTPIASGIFGGFGSPAPAGLGTPSGTSSATPFGQAASTSSFGGFGGFGSQSSTGASTGFGFGAAPTTQAASASPFTFNAGAPSAAPSGAFGSATPSMNQSGDSMMDDDQPGAAMTQSSFGQSSSGQSQPSFGGFGGFGANTVPGFSFGKSTTAGQGTSTVPSFGSAVSFGANAASNSGDSGANQAKPTFGGFGTSTPPSSNGGTSQADKPASTGGFSFTSSAPAATSFGGFSGFGTSKPETTSSPAPNSTSSPFSFSSTAPTTTQSQDKQKQDAAKDEGARPAFTFGSLSASPAPSSGTAPVTSSASTQPTGFSFTPTAQSTGTAQTSTDTSASSQKPFSGFSFNNASKPAESDIGADSVAPMSGASSGGFSLGSLPSQKQDESKSSAPSFSVGTSTPSSASGFFASKPVEPQSPSLSAPEASKSPFTFPALPAPETSTTASKPEASKSPFTFSPVPAASPVAKSPQTLGNSAIGGLSTSSNGLATSSTSISPSTELSNNAEAKTEKKNVFSGFTFNPPASSTGKASNSSSFPANSSAFNAFAPKKDDAKSISQTSASPAFPAFPKTFSPAAPAAKPNSSFTSPFSAPTAPSATDDQGMADMTNDNAEVTDQASKDVEEFLKKLRGLNLSLKRAIASRLQQSPFADLSPLIASYHRFQKEIFNEHPNAKQLAQKRDKLIKRSSFSANNETKPTFAFNVTPASMKPANGDIESSQPKAIGGFSFGNLPGFKPNTSSVFSNAFEQTTTTKSTEAAAPAASRPDEFSFNPAASPFVPSAIPSVGTPATQEAEDGEEEEEVSGAGNNTEQRQSGQGEENEDSLLTVRCKIFKLADSKWSEQGIAFVKLNQNRETRKKRILARSENGNRVIINSQIFPGITVRVDKNRLTMLLTSAEDKQMHHFMFRLKTPEEAADSAKIIEQHELAENFSKAERAPHDRSSDVHLRLVYVSGCLYIASMEELSYLNHPTISPSFFDQQPGVDPSLEVTRSKSVPMPTARSHPHNLKCTPLSTSDPFSRTVPSSDHSAAASSRSWSPSKSSMKHNGVAAARKEVICQFYLEGKCRDGDACRFSHKLDPTRVCAYFREGNCKIGEKCLNLHPGESQPYRDNVWATYLARQHEQQQQQQEELVRVAELGALLDNLDMGATNVPQHHFTADETFIDISKLSRQEEQDLLELTVDLERRKRPRPLLTLHKINHRQEPDRWPRRYQTDSSLSSSPPSQRSSPSNYLPDFQHYPRYDWAFNDSSRDTDSSADVTDDELPFSIRGFDR
ncbi:hypothetical protein BZG36_04588, partial [Bifiguratus adelaidae]